MMEVARGEPIACHGLEGQASYRLQPTSLAVTPTAPRAGARDAPAAPALEKATRRAAGCGRRPSGLAARVCSRLALALRSASVQATAASHSVALRLAGPGVVKEVIPGLRGHLSVESD